MCVCSEYVCVCVHLMVNTGSLQNTACVLFKYQHSLWLICFSLVYLLMIYLFIYFYLTCKILMYKIPYISKVLANI